MEDPDGEMEALRSAFDVVEEDIGIVKKAQFFIYMDSRKINRKLKKYKVRTDKNE
jgi:hypothetical protein